MAITPAVDARAMAEALAAVVASEPALEHLLVSTERDLIELWLLTAPTDADTERRLYGESIMLYDRFPDACFRVHVLNPAYFEDGDVSGIVPAGAEEIPLPAR
jgi:hypothetical protein